MSIMSVQTLVPSSAKGKTRGLLGVFDGNINNDFTNAAGGIVCSPDSCSSQMIHEQFGETCK